MIFNNKRLFNRRLEPFFQHSLCIAEFWNTISNLPFVIIGLLRLYEGTKLPNFYILMILAGLASAIHHATTPKWTIVIDWIPIALSIVLVLYTGVWQFISITSWFQLLLAFSTLLADHIYHLMPVPWGHVVWHLVASLAIDNAYQSIEMNEIDAPFRTL